MRSHDPTRVSPFPAVLVLLAGAAACGAAACGAVDDDDAAGFFEFDLAGAHHRVARADDETCGFWRGLVDSCAVSQHSVETNDGAMICFASLTTGQFKDDEVTYLQVEVDGVHYAARGATKKERQVAVSSYGKEGERLVGTFSGVVADIDTRTASRDLELRNGRFDVPVLGKREHNCEH
jgi:hypothetical protein